MSVYGKALTTYKKINRIKSSVNNIAQAQSDINIQRMKSEQKAREIASDNELISSIGQGAIQLGAVAGQQFAPEHSERIKNISTAASFATSVGVEANSQRRLQRQLTGLGQDGAEAFSRNSPNIMDSATQTYALNENVSEARLTGEYDSFLDNLYENGFDGDRGQALRFLRDNYGSKVYGITPEEFMVAYSANQVRVAQNALN